MNHEQLHKVHRLISGHKEAEPLSPPLVEQRGDFLTICQGDQVVLLTKKEAFAHYEKFRAFVFGDKK
jgi:hypothetical protein